ncbi:hypothetical protein DM02DRAFT_681668, partial [Periconia macrospinosa]
QTSITRPRSHNLQPRTSTTQPRSAGLDPTTSHRYHVLKAETTNNTEGRQTTIMSNEEAVALAQQTQARPKSTKNRGATSENAGIMKLSGIRKTGAPKQQAAARASVPANKDVNTLTPVPQNGPKKSPAAKQINMTYYEENNLRIPLLDKNGRRKTPRQAKTLYAKVPINQLLEIVREYGGDVKAEELKTAGKKTIADWISEVEKQAFSNGLTSSGTPQGTRKRKNQDPSASLPQQTKKPKVEQPGENSLSQENERAINEEFEFQDLVEEAEKYEKPKEELNEAFPDGPPDGYSRDEEIRSQVDEYEFNNVSDEDTKWMTQRAEFLEDIHRIATGQHQQVEPPVKFLKPGKHGYDYENGREYFEGDPDLYTGYGHDVDPADEERLAREGDAFYSEYRKKYSGYLGIQWPCGCRYPRSDSDSEEE